MAAKVMSPAYFKLRLIPFFISKCKDKTWGVRKACADKYL